MSYRLKESIISALKRSKAGLDLEQVVISVNASRSAAIGTLKEMQEARLIRYSHERYSLSQ